MEDNMNGDHGFSLLLDDQALLSDYKDVATDEPPSDPKELFAVVKQLTVLICHLDWSAAVFGQYAGAELFRSSIYRARCAAALGKTADEAKKAGRMEFADGFAENIRHIFLNGTSLEREIMIAESKLEYLKSLQCEAPECPNDE